MPTFNPDTQENQELDRKVLHLLLQHQGKDHRIDRWDLVEEIYDTVIDPEDRNDDNLLDRGIRYSVGRLRATGYLICDLGDGAGRWMASNEKEFWEFYGYYIKPIKARADVAKALKKAAQERWPNLNQPSLFDAAELESV